MQVSGELIYYPDSQPGISRRRHGRGFRYLAPDGTSIDDSAERDRIKALAVPPAYEDVWICPKPLGHLQATGRDERQRKQYRYHPDWRAMKEAQKYDQLATFGEALPRIRRAVLRDLRGEAGDLDFAIAAVIAMIDRLSMRVGHADYTAENGSFGATTLRNRHVRLKDGAIHLDYTAKGGKQRKATLQDKTLFRVLDELHDLPGHELVTWLDDDGKPQSVTSDRINARLSEMAGTAGITAKTFRTWSGSEAALDALMRVGKPTIKSLSEAAAARLGNTPTIARNSYIHPAIIDLVDDPDTVKGLTRNLPDVTGLRQTERALLKLLG